MVLNTMQSTFDTNPLPHNPDFWRPWEKELLKTMWEKERKKVLWTDMSGRSRETAEQNQTAHNIQADLPSLS